MKLGNKIRSRREELGMSQTELAAKARLTQGYISQVERGAFLPKATTLIVIAASLDLEPTELLKEREAV